MYWTLASIPELQNLPPEQRRLIWNAARAKRREQRPYVALFFYLALIFIAIDLVKRAHHYDGGQLIGFALGIAFVAAIYHQWRITKLRPLTWEFIPGICRQCGRSVSPGTKSCPACRAPIPSQPTRCPETSVLAPAPQDRFYWTRKSIPELQNLPQEERNRIWKAVMRKAGNRWEVLFASLLLGAAPLIAGELMDRYKIPLAIEMLCMFAGVAIVQLIYFQWHVAILRPLMWEYLPGLCPHCGYDLKASPDRCPECGAEVARVSS